MNIIYKYICYSIVHNTCLCRRCTLIQYSVYVLYLYVMSYVYMVYSCMLYYYMHLYSCCSLDLVLRGSMRYTIVLCLYMYLYMYDSLILYDCYIYLFAQFVSQFVYLLQVLEVCQTSNTCLLSSVAWFCCAVK